MGICKILSTFACNPDRQAVRALQSQPEGAPVRDSCSKANVDPTVGNGLLTPQRVGEGKEAREMRGGHAFTNTWTREKCSFPHLLPSSTPYTQGEHFN